MRWLTNFYDFRFKSTATAAIGIHLTKAWLSQLVNFKNAIWSWGHFRLTTCNKIVFINLEKMPQKRMECLRLLSEHLAWIEHQFLSGLRDSRKAGRQSVGYDERCGEYGSQYTKVDWPKGLGLGLQCWGFKGVREELPRKRPSLFQSGQWHSTRTMHQSRTQSLSQTMWPRWASRQFLSLPRVQTLVPVTFSYSLSSLAVVMRELKR